jgi:hypothetical protein
MLECLVGAFSPQSQPLRHCFETVSEETYFCRECSSRNDEARVFFRNQYNSRLGVAACSYAIFEKWEVQIGLFFANE